MRWPEDSILYKLMTLDADPRPMPVDGLPQLTKEQWRTWAGREYSFQFKATRNVPYPMQDAEVYGVPCLLEAPRRRGH